MILSTVASTPSTLTAFTESSREASEMYPMAFLFPATVVTTTEVLCEISAFGVVLSTSSTMIPISSVKAPLVPEPSSLETTVIGFPPSPSPSVLLPPQAAMVNTIVNINATAINFFIIIFPPYCFLPSSQDCLIFSLFRFEYTAPMLSPKSRFR